MFMKAAVRPCWNIKVPSDLIPWRWRRSCSCWFLMPHSNRLQLSLICSLCLVVFYKVSTALIHRPWNVRPCFLICWVFGVISGSDISWLFSHDSVIQSVGPALWSWLIHLISFWMDYHEGTLRLNPNDFGDPLTFLFVSPRDSHLCRGVNCLNNT